MKKVGRKTREWQRISRELGKRFLIAGITRCEVCGSSSMLTWAHRKKRRFCDTAELYVVALLCTGCHDFWESKSHAEMFAGIQAIIEKRIDII